MNLTKNKEEDVDMGQSDMDRRITISADDDDDDNRMMSDDVIL